MNIHAFVLLVAVAVSAKFLLQVYATVAVIMDAVAVGVAGVSVAQLGRATRKCMSRAGVHIPAVARGGWAALDRVHIPAVARGGGAGRAAGRAVASRCRCTRCVAATAGGSRTWQQVYAT